MGQSLLNKVCFITGASGIAAQTAAHAARAGASVFIASLHEDECRSVAQSLRSVKDDTRCDWAAADLTDESNVANAVEQCISRFGRIDALFNVVGISGRKFGDGPVHECTADAWQRTLDINFKSVFLSLSAVI